MPSSSSRNQSPAIFTGPGLDLLVIRDRGAHALVALIEPHEFELRRVLPRGGRVRVARPGAIQTREQVEYALQKAWRQQA